MILAIQDNQYKMKDFQEAFCMLSLIGRLSRHLGHRFDALLWQPSISIRCPFTRASATFRLASWRSRHIVLLDTPSARAASSCWSPLRSISSRSAISSLVRVVTRSGAPLQHAGTRHHPGDDPSIARLLLGRPRLRHTGPASSGVPFMSGWYAGVREVPDGRSDRQAPRGHRAQKQPILR